MMHLEKQYFSLHAKAHYNILIYNTIIRVFIIATIIRIINIIIYIALVYASK
jgi:hypothetical protein